MQYLTLDARAAYINLSNDISSECKKVKRILLEVIPWVVVAGTFMHLRDLSLVSPCADVVDITSKVLFGAVVCCVGKSAFNGLRIVDPNIFFKPRVLVVKEEFEAMKLELLFLRQRQEGLKTHNLSQILDRSLLK